MEKNKLILEQLKNTLQFEVDCFPLAEAQDIAKLAYQASYGPQHAVQSPEKLYEWLAQEMQDLDTARSEPLLQPLWLHYPMFRLHLSTASKLAISLQQIHELFLQSCADPIPSPPITWNEVIETTYRIVYQMKLPQSKILATEFKDFVCTNPGPYHHSARYREVYRPHYRLVSLDKINLLSKTSSVYIEVQSLIKNIQKKVIIT